MVTGACAADDGADQRSSPASCAPHVTSQPVSNLIALPLDEARREANNRGFAVRVICRDGDAIAVDADEDPQRVNLVLEDGVVTAAVIG